MSSSKYTKTYMMKFCEAGLDIDDELIQTLKAAAMELGGCKWPIEGNNSEWTFLLILGTDYYADNGIESLFPLDEETFYELLYYGQSLFYQEDPYRRVNDVSTIPSDLDAFVLVEISKTIPFDRVMLDRLWADHIEPNTVRSRRGDRKIPIELAYALMRARVRDTSPSQIAKLLIEQDLPLYENKRTPIDSAADVSNHIYRIRKSMKDKS